MNKKIGFGAWQIGGSNSSGGKNAGWTDISKNDSIALIQKTVEAGIHFFDTSEAYGNGLSEELLGEALSSKPYVEICTKFGWKNENGSMVQDFNPSRLKSALNASLNRLKRGKADYYLLHNPKPTDITPELISALNQLKAEGLVGAIGISVGFIEPYLDKIPFFDSFELIDNELTQQNRPFYPLLTHKKLFLRSVFASGLLLMDAGQLKAGPSQFKDWRSSLPAVMFTNALKLAEEEPDYEKRYKKLLNQSFDLGADRIIIGISKQKHLDLLKKTN